jgi:phytanoyl-CoA hydroxylase
LDKVEPEHLAFYDEFGFIHFENFFSREYVQGVWEAIAKAHKYIIDHDIDKINGIPVKFGVDEKGNKIVQRLPFTNKMVPEVQEMYATKKLDLIKAFIPDYESRIGFDEKDGAVCNYFVNVENSTYKQMGWHTDVLRDFLMLRKVLPMINVGIYFDDSGEVNGGLRIIPGTHKQSVPSMLFKKLQILDKKEDPNEVLVTAHAGDLVLHDGRLWHRVARSPHVGEKSRRRVMYIPLICGKVEHKTDESKTPFYHKVNKLIPYN